MSPNALPALPGLLTMDSMMWAATTAMLWQVYNKKWTGSSIRHMLYWAACPGAIAIVSTATALVAFAYEIGWANTLAFLAIGSSGLFAMMVIVAYIRLVRNIPDKPDEDSSAESS